MAAGKFMLNVRAGIFLLLAGCAAPGLSNTSRNETVSPAASPVAIASLDGWYEGRQLPVDQTAVCAGQEKKVWFRVYGQTVEMYASRHRRSTVRHILLDGSVTADGRLTLRPQALSRSASGLIHGDTLMASDLPAEMDVAVRRHTCTYRYEAQRRPTE